MSLSPEVCFAWAPDLTLTLPFFSFFLCVCFVLRRFRVRWGPEGPTSPNPSFLLFCVVQRKKVISLYFQRFYGFGGGGLMSWVLFSVEDQDTSFPCFSFYLMASVLSLF